MGFRLSEAVTFNRTVSFSLPSGLGWRPIKLEAEYKITGSDETKHGGSVRTNRALLEEVLVGVKGIDDAEGNPLSPEEGARAARNHDVAAQALASAYVEATNEGANRKN